MGHAVSTSQKYNSDNQTPNNFKIWRHDRKDFEAMNALFEKELMSLKKAGYSKFYILHHMKTYKKGVMDMRKELIDIMTEELIPEVWICKIEYMSTTY